MKTACRLKKLESKSGSVRIEFSAIHENGDTTLDQPLILKKEAGRWTAGIEMLEFPQMDTAQEAADKLADWLRRMADAICSRKYDVIPIEEVGTYGEGEGCHQMKANSDLALNCRSKCA